MRRLTSSFNNGTRSSMAANRPAARARSRSTPEAVSLRRRISCSDSLSFSDATARSRDALVAACSASVTCASAAAVNACASSRLAESSLNLALIAAIRCASVSAAARFSARAPSKNSSRCWHWRSTPTASSCICSSEWRRSNFCARRLSASRRCCSVVSNCAVTCRRRSSSDVT